MAIGGGQQWDDKAQGTLTQPQGLFDIQTQRFIDAPSSSSSLPKVGEVKDGYHFKGGNPDEQS